MKNETYSRNKWQMPIRNSRAWETCAWCVWHGHCTTHNNNDTWIWYFGWFFPSAIRDDFLSPLLCSMLFGKSDCCTPHRHRLCKPILRPKINSNSEILHTFINGWRVTNRFRLQIGNQIIYTLFGARAKYVTVWICFVWFNLNNIRLLFIIKFATMIGDFSGRAVLISGLVDMLHTRRGALTSNILRVRKKCSVSLFLRWVVWKWSRNSFPQNNLPENQ